MIEKKTDLSVSVKKIGIVPNKYVLSAALCSFLVSNIAQYSTKFLIKLSVIGLLISGILLNSSSK